MIAEIKAETEKSLKLLKKSKLTTRQKSIIEELTRDIEEQMRLGDWNIAVRLSYYRHEFSKAFNFLEWYIPFREIRKVRDQIDILRGKSD